MVQPGNTELVYAPPGGVQEPVQAGAVPPATPRTAKPPTPRAEPEREPGAALTAADRFSRSVRAREKLSGVVRAGALSRAARPLWAGGEGPAEAAGGSSAPLLAGRPTSGGEGAYPLTGGEELTFLPLTGAADRGSGADKARPKSPMGMDSEYIRSLPQWAQELLAKPEGGGPAPAAGPAAGGGAGTWPPSGGGGQTPGAPGGQIHWSAPNGVGLPPRVPSPVFSSRVGDRADRPAEVDWKAPGGGGTGEGAPPLSEAELRRTADKVYRLIEERLRRELRRSGR